MSDFQPRVLVLSGDGINCERETAEAFEAVGFSAEIHHLNDLILDQVSLEMLSDKFQVLALPGGFSFADDLGSGKILALKIKHGLGWNLSLYAQKGGLVLGICNGFQALIRLGVFGYDLSITRNDSGVFMNRWVRVSPDGDKCVWLKGMGDIELPIRHGEGKIVFQSIKEKETLDRLHRFGMDCLRYENNPNGSEANLAGLCDMSGRILGMMPHPEAFVRWSAHPEWTIQKNRALAPGAGLSIFQNAFQEVKKRHQENEN
ncbi:MAG: phosphoribosylformylglycinamidine synthase [Bdellovibrionaceae bacterium]|nr:phosphoribosylformylglycinamidine synthase [Pseudobdellovibrionaceae bacterium]|tara:strand:- start:2016 stop:2795 length:780 start_codon:yes stop_codon:yes gene_type:complete